MVRTIRCLFVVVVVLFIYLLVRKDSTIVQILDREGGYERLEVEPVLFGKTSYPTSLSSGKIREGSHGCALVRLLASQRLGSNAASSLLEQILYGKALCLRTNGY